MKTEKITPHSSSEFNFDENIAEDAELKSESKDETLLISSVSQLNPPIIEPPTSGDVALLGDETPEVLESPTKRKHHCHCQECGNKWETYAIPTFCPVCKSAKIAYI